MQLQKWVWHVVSKAYKKRLVYSVTVRILDLKILSLKYKIESMTMYLISLAEAVIMFMFIFIGSCLTCLLRI